MPATATASPPEIRPLDYLGDRRRSSTTRSATSATPSARSSPTRSCRTSATGSRRRGCRRELAPRARQARPARACTSTGYGCAGASATAYGLACLELEAGDSGVRSLVSVQGSLAMFAIWRWGSEEQKQEWLPRMAAGEAIGCFGLTEPDAGSDPGSMRTRARRDGDDWILHGQKMWITNGSIADVAVVWARDRRRRPRLPRPEGARPASRPRTSTRSCRCAPRSPPSCCSTTCGCRPTRCCPRPASLRGPALVPERGALRDRLGRGRRGARLLRGGARLQQGADRSSTGRSRRSRSSSRSWRRWRSRSTARRCWRCTSGG